MRSRSRTSSPTSRLRYSRDQRRAAVAGHDVGHDDWAVKRAIGLMTTDERSFYWRVSGEEDLRPCAEGGTFASSLV